MGRNFTLLGKKFLYFRVYQLRVLHYLILLLLIVQDYFTHWPSLVVEEYDVVNVFAYTRIRVLKHPE